MDGSLHSLPHVPVLTAVCPPPVHTHGKLISEQTRRATKSRRLHTKISRQRESKDLLGIFLCDPRWPLFAK